jgi:hypothetical protein
MIDRHQQSLEMRRHELIARSRAQRAALQAMAQPLVEKAAIFDRATASVRRHPMLATAIAGAVVLFGSRKLFTWVSRGIALYTLLRKA